MLWANISLAADSPPMEPALVSRNADVTPFPMRNTDVETVTRFSVSLPASLARELDRMTKEKGYHNRSLAIADMIRAYLVEHRQQKGDGEIAGSITLVYDHHRHHLLDLLTDLQHDHQKEIMPGDPGGARQRQRDQTSGRRDDRRQGREARQAHHYQHGEGLAGMIHPQLPQPGSETGSCSCRSEHARDRRTGNRPPAAFYRPTKHDISQAFWNYHR